MMENYSHHDHDYHRRQSDVVMKREAREETNFNVLQEEEEANISSMKFQALWIGLRDIEDLY